jgi:hypothetical protein
MVYRVRMINVLLERDMETDSLQVEYIARTGQVANLFDGLATVAGPDSPLSPVLRGEGLGVRGLHAQLDGMPVIPI